MNPDELRDAADRAAELLDNWEQSKPFETKNVNVPPDLLAVLGPAARQLADTQDECERLRGEVETWHEVAARTLALLDEKDRLRRTALAEVQRLRTVLDGLLDAVANEGVEDCSLDDLYAWADVLDAQNLNLHATWVRRIADAAAAARGEG